MFDNNIFVKFAVFFCASSAGHQKWLRPPRHATSELVTFFRRVVRTCTRGQVPCEVPFNALAASQSTIPCPPILLPRIHFWPRGIFCTHSIKLDSLMEISRSIWRSKMRSNRVCDGAELVQQTLGRYDFRFLCFLFC